MNLWDQYQMTDKIVEVLADVHCNNDFHHFGRPFISAYQIAIELNRRYSDELAPMDKPVGGAGIGQHNSLAQYVGNELSRQIKTRGATHPVDGAFFSNENAKEISFASDDGEVIESSLVGTGFDMAMFRLRSDRRAA